jgi:hypothetical protein
MLLVVLVAFAATCLVAALMTSGSGTKPLTLPDVLVPAIIVLATVAGVTLYFQSDDPGDLYQNPVKDEEEKG